MSMRTHPPPGSLAEVAATLGALGRVLPDAPCGLLQGVPGVLRRWAHCAPDALCLVDLERCFTAGQVDLEVDRLADFWRARGLNPGDCVAVLMGNRLEALLHTLAVGRLGGVTALVAPDLRGRALEHALGLALARALVCDADTAQAVETTNFRGALGTWLGAGSPGTLPLPDVRDALPERARRPRFDRPLGFEARFVLLYTSGTTGLPKAAPIRHTRWLMAGAAFQSFALHLQTHDVVFTPLPLHHASAQLVAWSSALAARCAFACAPHFSARAYLDQARTVGATVGVYVGELCRYLLQSPPRADDADHGLHTFVGNGLRGDIWPAFVERFGRPRIVEFYGATEGNVALVNRTGKVGSCGRPPPFMVGPLDGAELVRFDVATETHPRDADGHLQRAAPGEIGELIARIGWIPYERFDGYLDGAATEAKVLRDVFRTGDAYFRTGDLLTRDTDGDFFFVDRIGDTFRWKGENVSTQSVAEALVGAGGASLLVVYGVALPGADGRVGMAAVVPGLEGFDGKAFFEAAEARLRPAERPAFVRLTKSLETTGTQKFRRVALQREGVTPTNGDQVLRRSIEGRTYSPISAEERAAIEAGTLRP
jgi:fatty-acyl-CoA synthase